MNLILEGVVGSQAYGLATADSDEDRLGIFVAPLTDVLSLHPPGETKNGKGERGDYCYHELVKFMRLAASANPTILELLFLPEYTTSSFDGRMLVAHRTAFLSSRVVDTYGGYAHQQLLRLERRGDYGSDLKKRHAKHQRHLVRLLLQGYELLTTGSLNVRLTPYLADFVRNCGEMDKEQIAEVFYVFDSRLRSAQSVLPPQPDLDLIGDLLYDIRMRNV